MSRSCSPLCRILLVGLFLLIPSHLLLAEDSVDNTVRISEIRTNITGKTRRSALISELQIAEGRVYESLEYLEDVVELRLEELMRRRLFKELNLDIHSDDPGNIEIDIVLVDSFTVLPRPMIKYSSTAGLTLGLKVDYFNAFGTLSDQMLQGYWSPTEILFEYRIEKIVVGPFHMAADIQQFDGLTRYGDENGNLLVQYRETSTIINVTFKVPLGLRSPWSFETTPIVSWIYNQSKDFNYTSYEDSLFNDESFSPGLNLGFTTDQVNWRGNIREGFFVEVMNNNQWYIDSRVPDYFLDADMGGFLWFTQWFGLQGRISGFHGFSGVRKNAGDKLRGVLDYMTYGQYGAYLTVQPNFRLFKLKKSGISMHIAPFTDLGYIGSQMWTDEQSWEYCAGATLIFYLDAMPSLAFNIDWGYDFKRDMTEVIFDTNYFY